MGTIIEQLYELGQSIWCDNINQDLLQRGGLQRYIEQGIVGVTSNPTIFMKAIAQTGDYDARIAQLAASGGDLLAVYEGLVVADIREAADKLRPVYDRTAGGDGYVSLEVNPQLAYDTDGTLAEARRLWKAVDRPNLMIKVPATAEGMPALQALITEGINVNVTLIFALDAYEEVMQAYLAGLEHRAAKGARLAHVASVASFFVSRVDTLVDKLLAENDAPAALRGQAAVANAQLAYARFEEVFAADGPFGELAKLGARVQRPLWASTSTKDPAYPDTKYVDTLIGPQTVNTLPPETITAVLEHGTPAATIRDGVETAREALAHLEGVGISMDAVTDQLLREGVDAFARSFEQLLASLQEKLTQVQAAS